MIIYDGSNNVVLSSTKTRSIGANRCKLLRSVGHFLVFKEKLFLISKGYARSYHNGLFKIGDKTFL